MSKEEVIEAMETLEEMCVELQTIHNGMIPKKNAILNKGVIISKVFAVLKKQQALKPELWGDGYYDGELIYDTGKCPSCGENYEFEYDRPKYCCECGQRLDWSEVELYESNY